MLKSLKSIFQSDKKHSFLEQGDGKIICQNLSSSPFGSYIPNGILGDTRVVFLSDIHCKHYKVGFGVDVTKPNSLTQEEKLSMSIQSLPFGDILIISGDFVETGLLEELEMFNTFIKGIANAKKFKHIVFICGNHERTVDIDFYESEGWRYHQTKQDVTQCRNALFNDLPENVHYLFDNCVELEGLKIYGTPWVLGGESYSSETSPSHFRWAYSVTEEELVSKYSLIPDDVDILITHMPPYGIGDGRRNYDKDYFDENDRQILGYDHDGSTSLCDRLASLNPIIHCYGHIHSGYGAYRPRRIMRNSRRSTLFVNAANCDEDYVPIQPAMVVDIESNVISSNTLISGQYSKKKLDTAVALLVAIDEIAKSTRDGHLLSNFKITARAFLKQVLATNYSAKPHFSSGKNSKNDKSLKKIIKKNIDHVETMEKELHDFLTQHSFLEAMYVARSLSRGGEEDSTGDFRSMQLVVPRLFIGSVYPSECKETLDKFGITHIVNCCNGWEPTFPNDFTYLNLHVEDVEEQDLSMLFIDCIAFIDGAIMNSPSQSSATSLHSRISDDTCSEEERKSTSFGCDNNVYIHCQLGISRSAAVVIAYLMFTLQITYRDAFALVKRARPFICPNSGFIEQLLKFEYSLRIQL
jgi:Icc-related predicted phosphoesterase